MIPCAGSKIRCQMCDGHGIDPMAFGTISPHKPPKLRTTEELSEMKRRHSCRYCDGLGGLSITAIPVEQTYQRREADP